MWARAIDRGARLAYLGPIANPWTPRSAPSSMNPPQTTPPPRDYSAICPRLPDGPVELSSLCPDGAEIELEIGFGRGMFLIQRAASAPAAFLLGFEIKTKWAYLVEQRCAREDLTNVRVIGGDVREIFPRLRPDGRIARAFMHFPDPWWKKRHAKRRLVGGEMLDELARLLRPGGEFFVQTDVEERADLHAVQVGQHPAFELAGADGRIVDNPYAAVSNRERRAIEDGLPIYRVLAHRR